MQVYSIVTGASRGIGKSLATECARKGRNLILISLPDEKLSELACELAKTYNIETEYYETDLTDSSSVRNFFKWCNRKNLGINMLVNNAGIGSQGLFEMSSPEKFRNIMQLNMDAMVNMCWGAIPFLKEYEKSHILNVGSIGAFTPVPYKSIYSATKHFVLAFSDALHYELKETAIFVGCLCPGPTITSRLHKAKVKEQGLKAKLLTKTADEVAEYAIRKLLGGKRIIIPGLGNKLIARLGRLLPTKWRLELAGSAFSGSSFHHYKDT